MPKVITLERDVHFVFKLIGEKSKLFQNLKKKKKKLFQEKKTFSLRI